ncbi:MAG: Ldh family oxidoreductase [Candidatus Rokubacteria bacterium]|nr:Ldh family oxidoreductase [Candidatus Rokubacteria bacterium]
MASEGAVVVHHEQLKRFITEVLGALGMRRPIAEHTAALMVQTDLRGVDSHGIGMLPLYVEWTRKGYIDPAAEPLVVRDELATALVDGQRGLGHWTSTRAMTLAIEKAKAFGAGFVAVRNSNHFGACACYSMMALPHQLVGIAMTNSFVPAMVPTFGRKAMLSTNPLSVAVPAGGEPPFVLDMATTTVAMGKLTIASRWRKSIPEGWALDEQGHPASDPDVALKNRLLTPLGGSRELGSHKGYGLGAVVDILSGVLPGAVYGDLFLRSGMEERRHTNVGHFFGAIDIARFRPLDEFRAAMDDMLRALKATPPAEGQERVWVAGEPETECERRRLVEGIPLAPALVSEVNELALTLGVAPLG